MGLYLTIDRGNSAVKAAVWDGDEMLVAQGGRKETVETLVQSLSERFGRFSTAIYCSVVADNKHDAAVDAVGKVADKTIVLTDKTPMPVSLDYRTPETLGRDRIAAIVGARVLAGEGFPLLVVDIGTAVTYDYLSADNHFVGGNIAPGIYTRLEALNAFTSALPLVEPEGATPLWGQTTVEALRSGALRGVVAELDYYYRQVEALGAKVVLTGGASHMVTESGLLSFEYFLDNNIVHKGLNRIIRYNENN